MADYSKAKIAVPGIQTDKVLIARSLTINTDNTAGHTTTVTADDSPYYSTNGYGLVPFGVFSTDNGTTWQDIISDNRVLSFLDVQVAVYAYTGSVSQIKIRVNTPIGVDPTTPVIVNYGLLDAPDRETVTYVSGTYSQKTAYDSRTPSPRIALQGSISDSPSTTTTVAHGVSGIPDVRYFTTELTGGGGADPYGFTRLRPYIETAGLRIDATNLYIDTIGVGGDIDYYEVYYP